MLHSYWNARPTWRRLCAIIVLIIMVNFMLGEMFTLVYWCGKFGFTDADFFMNNGMYFKLFSTHPCASFWNLSCALVLHSVGIATDWPRNRGSVPSRTIRIFSSAQCPDLLWGTPIRQGVPGAVASVSLSLYSKASKIPKVFLEVAWPIRFGCHQFHRPFLVSESLLISVDHMVLFFRGNCCLLLRVEFEL
jgi:hypothetical protein